MLNIIWPLFIVISFIYAFFSGNIEQVSNGIFESLTDVVNLSLTFLGTMCLWNGIMEIAKKTTLIKKLTSFLKPLIKFLFPELTKNEKAKEEIEAIIKEEGERAIIETGVIGLHPDLTKLIGKLKYRTSYGQNVLNHSIEVSNLARIMAEELGLDPKLARRAGLLHDIGKALDHDMEGTHVEIGVDILKKYKENEKVINAVQAHHGDVEPQTIEAVLIQAADAISASRPGARRETLETYIKRLESLEQIADSFEGVEKSFAIQAGREIRIIVKPEKISDDQMVLTARDIAKRVEDEMEYPGQIKVNLVRETRVVEYAK
mgnify:CR=1 FL=1